jgi:hypothetical protein
LQIWDAYQKHINMLARQKVKVSDVPIDLRIEGRPLIVSGGPLTVNPNQLLTNVKLTEQFAATPNPTSEEALKSSLLSQARL